MKFLSFRIAILATMYALNALLVLCLAVSAYGAPGTQIVGGKDAPVGRFPYQVSLRQNGRHFCGGSIINANNILTAAHCVVGLGNFNSVTVHAGTNQLNQNGDVYRVKNIVHHSGYDSQKIINDVALIQVSSNIKMSSRVQPIALASGSNSFEGSACVLSGWGTTRLGGSAPNNLQFIDLVVEPQSRCKQTHSYLQSDQICTLTKRGEGACHGDSGGPLVANGVQIGVVSYGRPCALGKPDVYTRVSSFLPWIKAHQASLMDEVEMEKLDVDQA